MVGEQVVTWDEHSGVNILGAARNCESGERG